MFLEKKFLSGILIKYSVLFYRYQEVMHNFVRRLESWYHSKHDKMYICLSNYTDLAHSHSFDIYFFWVKPSKRHHISILGGSLGLHEINVIICFFLIRNASTLRIFFSRENI